MRLPSSILHRKYCSYWRTWTIKPTNSTCEIGWLAPNRKLPGKSGNCRISWICLTNTLTWLQNIVSKPQTLEKSQKVNDTQHLYIIWYSRLQIAMILPYREFLLVRHVDFLNFFLLFDKFDLIKPSKNPTESTDFSWIPKLFLQHSKMECEISFSCLSAEGHNCWSDK